MAIMSLKKPKRAKSYHSKTFPMTPAMVCMVLFAVSVGSGAEDILWMGSSSSRRCSLLLLPSLDVIVILRDQSLDTMGDGTGGGVENVADNNGLLLHN